MAKHFECKFKGRLGHGADDLKEIRVLNRIVRIVPEGLLYEPDPRHIELLAKGVDLIMQQSNSRATPGIKPKWEDVPPEESIESIIASIRDIRRQNSKVTFSDSVEFVETPFYYVQHAWDKLLTGAIGSTSFIPVPNGHDRFTGLHPKELAAVKESVAKDWQAYDVAKHASLSRTLKEGAMWETSSSSIVAKISKGRFKKKRIGNKAARAAERMLASQDVLGPEEATEYRALAARANYLALD